jgi:hypothetical protein
MSDYIDFEIYKINPGTGIRKTTTCNPGELKCVILLGQDDPDTMAFLTKILSSLNISLANECNIIAAEEDASISFKDIFINGHADHIISFGLNKMVFNTQANLTLRDWNHFESFSLLLFDRLKDISASTDLKRKLWDRIKILKNG